MIKSCGKLSEIVRENIGVNQGAITSPFLFKEYISDLKIYLDEYTGISIGDEIIVHELWADDLYLVADNFTHSQMQLDGLGKFCAPNHMIANEIKTKVMVYGNIKETDNVDLTLNGKIIEKVDSYKSLGNVLNSIRTMRENMFKLTPGYLNCYARQAIFGMKCKLKI